MMRGDGTVWLLWLLERYYFCHLLMPQKDLAKITPKRRGVLSKILLKLFGVNKTNRIFAAGLLENNVMIHILSILVSIIHVVVLCPFT
jgi:hypothetical protein